MPGDSDKAACAEDAAAAEAAESEAAGQEESAGGAGDAEKSGKTRQAADALWDELERLECEAAHWKALCQAKEAALHDAQAARDRLEGALLALKCGVRAEEAPAAALLAALILDPSARVSLTQALSLVGALFPSRLVILPSAFQSAARLDEVSKRGNRLLKLLLKLATSYYDALVSKGDSVARKVFSPEEYSARETERTSSGACGRSRDFVFNGRRIRMEQHLKIGIASDAACTLRCYFAWLAGERKIVIGHCGEHLPVASHK